MDVATPESLPALYHEDEVAWLDAMAEIIRRRDLAALDLDSLHELLTDMAIRERRELKSRHVVLMTHQLKWRYQPKEQTRSWETTALVQSQELADIAGRGVLRAHAESVLPDAYANAVKRAASETRLPRSTFPVDCPSTVEELLNVDLSEDQTN